MALRAARRLASRDIAEAQKDLNQAIQESKQNIQEAQRDLKDASSRSGATQSASETKSAAYCRGLEEDGISESERDAYRGCEDAK